MQQFYFYYQLEGGEESWLEALAESRAEIVERKRPRYTTVLDVSELVTAQHTSEQLAQLRYRGPLYFDWDHTDIDYTISKVQQFLVVLSGKGIDVEACRWYATGGRGFHLEIPQECFISKVPAKGVTLLHQIYREMANELVTDAMDMRVYSGRKGRMWRTPNVDRGNGKFKVPVTPQEIMGLTDESYAEICSAPRPEPERHKPAFSGELGLLYAKATQKIEAASKKLASSKLNLELLAKFKGAWPPTVERIMRGENLAEGVGFHLIAMQLGITANGLGKSEKDLLEACAGLIENHVSDGVRYNSKRKREAELSRMYRYTADNICYTYAKDAVKKLCAPGTDCTDLDGLSAEAGESLVPVLEGESAEDTALRGGLEMRERGIYKKDQENGIQMISDLSFKDVGVLLSMPQGDRPAELWGFDANVQLKGKSRGRQLIDMQVFLSKQRFQEFAMKNMGIMKGTDNDVASLSTILRDAAQANGKISYVTRREGFEIVQRPDTPEKQLDLLWVQSDGVYGGPENLYIYRPLQPSGSLFNTDLWHAPMLDASNDERAFLDALFQLNEPFVIATLLGWMTASFHRSFYQRAYSAFPLCMVWGMAGSGKTQTSKLLCQMFYNMNEPTLHQASGLTPYVIEMHMSGSSSIPFLLDEYKVSEFSPEHRKRVHAILRGAYNNGAIGRGGDKDQIGSSYKSIGMQTMSAPFLYVGEQLETQTAIIERTVSVPVSKAGHVGRAGHLKLVSRNRQMLGRLGRSILAASFSLDIEALREKMERNIETAYSVHKQGSDRPAFNLAVTLTGFDFMTAVIRSKYGEEFTHRLAGLRAAMMDDTKQVIGSIMAEASKVLDAIAYISKNEDSGSPNGLKPGIDYEYVSKGGEEFIDLRLDTAWIKYSTWCTAKSQPKLYDNFAAFAEGLAHYSPMVNRHCIDSNIKEGGNTKVYRFSLVKLVDEGVQSFKDSPVEG